MTLAEIRKATPRKRYEEEESNPWGQKVLLPSSFYLAYLALKLGLTANKVSILGLGIGILGCYLVQYFIIQVLAKFPQV